MSYLIKRADVVELVDRLAAAKSLPKIEAIKLALERELEREAAKPSLVDVTLDFAAQLRKRTDPEGGLPADKAWIDGLYEES